MLTRFIYVLTIVFIALLGLGWSQANADHPVLANIYCTEKPALERLVTAIHTSQETAYQAGKDLIQDDDFKCYGEPGGAVRFEDSVIERWFTDYEGEDACVLEGTIAGTTRWALSDDDMCWAATHQEAPAGA